MESSSQELKTELQQKHNNNNLKSDNYFYDSNSFERPPVPSLAMGLANSLESRAQPKLTDEDVSEPWREAHIIYDTCVPQTEDQKIFSL